MRKNRNIYDVVRLGHTLRSVSVLCWNLYVPGVSPARSSVYPTLLSASAHAGGNPSPYLCRTFLPPPTTAIRTRQVGELT